jgi:hypothetical protein
MSTCGRRWLLAGLALAAGAVLGLVGFLAFGADSAEGARRRVPLGADEEAVIQALGRVGEAALGRGTGLDGMESRRVLAWDYDDDLLLVEFDAEGRAVRASVHRWRDSTLWERLRAWLGF